MIYAPVVIPTLCRYEHFKRCIESLSRCTGAEHTEVYIGLDYPAKESHWDGYNKIKDYLEHCGNLGFKKLYVVKRPHNYGFGPKGNYTLLKEYVFEKHDRLISSEDDNEFAPCFLDYMNKGLELYKDDESVFSISGYNYPIDMSGYEYNVYFTDYFSAWGCGLWRDKENIYNAYIGDSPLELFLSWRLIQKPKRKQIRYLSGLLLQYRKKALYGDMLRECYMQIEQKKVLFPTISKVRNWGNDGTGEHCKPIKKDIYSEQKIDKYCIFNYDFIEPECCDFLLNRQDRFRIFTIKAWIHLFCNFAYFILTKTRGSF